MTPKSKKKNLTPKVASATPTRSHTSTSMSMQSTNSGANREGAANHTRRSQTSVRSGTPPPPRLSQSIRSGGASAGEGTHSTTRSTRRQTSLSRGNTPRGSVNQGSVRSGTPGKQSNGRGATPNPNESLQEMPISQLLSRLLNNTRLGDMRPDICRFDANSKEDVRYLYEVQHRAYPEFRSVTRRGNTEIANRMLRSRVFDFINEPEPPAKPPQAAKSPRALKSDDGLGALTRFIYSAEGRPVSPHGRRRCLTPSNRNAVVSDPILCKGHPLTPRLGKYRPPVRTQSNLGRDLVVSDQSAEAATPRPRIRSLSGVRTFEARQPALTIPPRRKAGICISALQDHVANKDNDIFGVRRRREYDEQQRRVRVESAARSVSPRVARSLSIEKGEETPAPSIGPFTPRSDGQGDAADRISTMQKRTTTPYGDEQPEEVGSRAARETSEPTYFSPRENAGGGLPRGTPFDRQAVVVSPRTASLVSPRSSGGGRIYDGPYELSPCKRTGRGRVMGHNVMKSSIAFGDANIPMSPSSVRSPRSNHLNSSRVRDLLTWT